MLVCALLNGCKNPLGGEDHRDSSFAPGGGGGTIVDGDDDDEDDGGGDTTPPNPPTSPQINAVWVTGNNPVSSPLFTWVNFGDADFQRAEVAVGTTVGGTQILSFQTSNTNTSHIFSNLNLTECFVTYYPSVRSVDTSGNISSIATVSTGFRYDNTLPTAVASVNIPANDGSPTQAPTANWSATPGVDNCGVSHYEIAIGYDANSDGIESDELENVMAWTEVPGGSATTSYQIQHGVDGFIFSGEFGRQYYTSIRVVDGAGLTSTVRTSAAWYTFYPSHISNLEVWLDGNDSSMHFQTNTCTMAATTVGTSVGCWKNKVSASHNAVQATAGAKPRVGNDGLVFDGVDDILTISSKTYTHNSNLSFMVLYKADTQTNDAGSCCRPIVSFSSNSTGLYPWVGLSRGNLVPANNFFHGWSGSAINPFPTSSGDMLLMSVLHNGTSARWNVFESGTQGATDVVISSYTSTAFNVGGDTVTAARKIKGEISEVLIFEKVLTQSEREKLEGYVACKYDLRDTLTVAHPYHDMVGANKTGCP